MARNRGKVALVLNTPAEISEANLLKTHIILHIAAGSLVYLGESAAELATPTDGWLLPTGVPIDIPCNNEAIYAVTPDGGGANLMVWECYRV